MIDHNFIIPKENKKKKDVTDPLEKPLLYFIVGGTGSGKSTLLANLLMTLEEKHDFTNALFVTSNNRDKLLEAVEMDITSSPSDLSEFMLKVRQAKGDEKSILVLDDIQGSSKFNIMLGRSEFIEFVLSHRHFGSGCWILATAQTLRNSYTPVFRNNVSLWFVYSPRSEPEKKAFLEISDPDKMKKAMGLLRIEGRHQFLYINKQNPDDIKYFLGFQRQLIDL